MNRADLVRWSLAVALAATPATLCAQTTQGSAAPPAGGAAPDDGRGQPANGAAAANDPGATAPRATAPGATAPGGDSSLATPDSAAASAAGKAGGKGGVEQVICRDGTVGIGAQGCANHGGVDAVTTNASRTGRVDVPVTGQAEPGIGGGGPGPGEATDTTVRVPAQDNGDRPQPGMHPAAAPDSGSATTP